MAISPELFPQNPNEAASPRAAYNQLAHILVVDDDPDIAEPLIDYLSHFGGYVTSVAYSGQEAIDILSRAHNTPAGPVDIVLLDMRMPDITGLDVLAWIRKQPDLQFTRVLMLTATIGNTEKIRALEAGADDYITKPYQYQELVARVRTNLRSRELEKQLQWQSQQLSLLNRISRDVAANLHIQTVLVTALEGVQAMFGVALAAVYLLNNPRDLLTCFSLQSEDEALSIDHMSPVPAGAGMIGLACEHHAVFYVNENETHGAFSASIDAPLDYDVHSMMVGGLFAQSRSLGTLVAWNKNHGSFTDFEADLFKSLANSISRAIENAMLFQKLQARQQELIARRNRLQAVIDGILQPIYTVDEKWRLRAVNQNRAEELNVQPSEVVGQICYQAFFHRDTPCEHCRVRRVIAHDRPQSWSVRWLGEDHLPQEWNVSAYALPKTKAEGSQSVVVWQNRTEERRLESSLMQAGKLAAIGQLAAGVAHEINNPLTVINANAEMLKMILPSGSDELEMIDLIHRAGDRATKVVRGLLNSARQEEYEFTTVDVNESIEAAIELVRFQLQAAEIELQMEMDTSLPLVLASNEHLKSVWINLLVNASDALKEMEGERLIELITRLSPDQRYIQIVVVDNGVGMNAAQLGHIFEPFYTTKDPDKGTGLGLATCYRIIEQHGGQIDVLSDPGEGTTFIVVLPVAIEGDEAATDEDGELETDEALYE